MCAIFDYCFFPKKPSISVEFMDDINLRFYNSYIELTLNYIIIALYLLLSY